MKYKLEITPKIDFTGITPELFKSIYDESRTFKKYVFEQYLKNIENENAEVEPGRNFTNEVGMELVWVAPLKCWVGKYHVTQEEYEKVTGKNPSYFNGPRRPVETVRWNDATLYCEKLTSFEADKGTLIKGYHYALPTDAQYDVYVGNASLDDAITSLTCARSSTEDVGTKRPNNFGLYDTRGNVWQWMQDWYDDSIRAKDSRNPSGTGGGQKYKTLRGGSWDDNSPDFLVVSCRLDRVPGDANGFVGFRVVLTPQTDYLFVRT
jgi:formylglycine-generating enzyme required for sulfatase activity